MPDANLDTRVQFTVRDLISAPRIYLDSPFGSPPLRSGQSLVLVGAPPASVEIARELKDLCLDAAASAQVKEPRGGLAEQFLKAAVDARLNEKSLEENG